MPLQVTLVENTLHNGLPLRPRVVNRVTVEFEEILRFMAMDTALEEDDMRLAVDRLKKALVFYTAKGNAVQTPLGIFAAHVRGERNGSPVTPDIGPQGMKLRYRPNRGFYQEIQNRLAISVEEQLNPKLPVISTLTNVDQPAAADELSPGQLFHIVGARLAFHTEAEDEGVFFVDAAGTGYRATVYSRHGTKIVDGKVPDLPAGPYTVQLRARRTEGCELRNGTYANTITVP